MATVYDFSAGGIVRSASGEVVVIQFQNLAGEPVWGLPKGHPKKHETAIEAALRETSEETGLLVEAEAGREPGVIDYWFRNKSGDLVHKRVEFYLMRPVGGDISDHDEEVIEARWMALADALELLTYENERDMLARTCA